MPRSARGSEALSRVRGFTLVELIVVVAIVALVAGLATVALRDPDATQLEREAARLSALLEAARAQARTTETLVRWEPRSADAANAFRFVGLPAAAALPSRWLGEGVRADVIGASAVVLGPEPLVGAQSIVLRLGDRQLTLSTDGLGPFVVTASDRAP